MAGVEHFGQALEQLAEHGQQFFGLLLGCLVQGEGTVAGWQRDVVRVPVRRMLACAGTPPRPPR
jgi:hypothetical protein